MRKRVGGAVILVAVGIGIWLNSLFTGIGPGGDDSDIGRIDEVSVNVENNEVLPSATTEQPSEIGIPEGSVPTVLIDDRQYLLQSGEGAEETFQPITLNEIVRLAQTAQTGEDGIQLHVKRRETSRASTENALTDALRQANVPDSAVQHHAGFVE